METATTEGRPLIHALEPERVDAPSAAARVVSALPGIAAAGVIVALGFADGGYFATAWGPLTLVFLSFAVIALLARPQQNVGLRTLAMPALLGLLVIGLSPPRRRGAPSEAVPEVERTLAYLSAALALGLVLRRGATAGVLIGLWAGISIVCLGALAAKRFPRAAGELRPGFRVPPLRARRLLECAGSLGPLRAASRVRIGRQSGAPLGEGSGRSVSRPARAHGLLHVQPGRVVGLGRRPSGGRWLSILVGAAGDGRRGDSRGPPARS